MQDKIKVHFDQDISLNYQVDACYRYKVRCISLWLFQLLCLFLQNVRQSLVRAQPIMLARVRRMVAAGRGESAMLL